MCMQPHDLGNKQVCNMDVDCLCQLALVPENYVSYIFFY